MLSKIKCGHCDGSGIRYHNATCHVCKGLGFVWSDTTRFPARTAFYCPVCPGILRLTEAAEQDYDWKLQCDHCDRQFRYNGRALDLIEREPEW